MSNAQNLNLSNRLVEFKFTSANGTFSIIDKRDGSSCIENAVFGVDNYSSEHLQDYQTTLVKVTDDLGIGQKLTITGKVKDRPTLSLILEVFLYDDRGCVVLNQGVQNSATDEYRVMQFSPLKAIAYPGKAFVDYRALDGGNGAELTQVTSADSLHSLNNLMVTFGGKNAAKRSLVIGGLSYHEFQKHAAVTKNADGLAVELKADDPVGKLIDAHSTYLFNDKFYIDFTTDNRFEALESYGSALALATHAEISGVNFPILNFWYANIAKFGGDQFRNNSDGTIEEMEEILKTGFLKYGPVGLRLEPDDYALPNNQQGWWDDQHWQKYKSGQLIAPYETIVKWGKKLREMGGVPFIYCQTAKRSEDYCEKYPEQMLFNSATHKRSKGPVGWWGRMGDKTAEYWTYDFTDPAFIAHMQNVYRNLKAGTVQGIKFDYPSTGWSYDGGFEDKHATCTSAYRNIFKLAYDGLGPGRDVQERIPPYGDVALGVITTQRTEGDNDRVYPARVMKTGLRWYKNRVVANYDCDPINPAHVYPTDSRDGWRAAVTMTFTTSGRMEIGKYFEKISADMLHDLSRAVPLLTSPARSARPIDAFTGKPYPQIYDFTIDPTWHIVTFFNQQIEGEQWPTDVMAYWEEHKQFIPKKMVPAQINLPLGDATDDGGLALDPHKQYQIFDFWNWAYVGKFAGDANLQQQLRPGEARIMAVHEATPYPQFLSTDRHILQGYLDMPERPLWNNEKMELSGVANLVADEPFKVAIATNGFSIKNVSAADGTKTEITEMDKARGIYALSINSTVTRPTAWSLSMGK